jgi:hypothetical protein
VSLIEPLPLKLVSFVVRHRWTIAAIALAIVVIILLMSLRSCLTPQPRLDEEQIQRGEQAIRERNDRELRNILVNSDVRAKEINENVAGASLEVYNAARESRLRWANANIDELREEFERRKQQR